MSVVSDVIRPLDTAPTSPLAAGVTTVILTYNEEMHIARAIGSAKAFSKDILIVDSFSNDRTVEIAEAEGVRVLQNRFTSHARQFNWGLEHGNIRTEWILRLDADELIGPDLAVRINTELPTLGRDVAGILLNRRHVFMGRWVRHGGRYPLLLLRLWRTGHGEVEDRWMDEHVVVRGGRTIRFAGEFSDSSERDLAFFVDKHNGYAAREAVEVLGARYNLFDKHQSKNGETSGWQAKLKRFIKEKIYGKLPFGVGPLSYFIFRYVFQLGFCDGRSGFIYHFLQGLWYRFLVDAKIYEFDRAIAGCRDREERLLILSQISGLKL